MVDADGILRTVAGPVRFALLQCRPESLLIRGSGHFSRGCQTARLPGRKLHIYDDLWTGKGGQAPDEMASRTEKNHYHRQRQQLTAGAPGQVTRVRRISQTLTSKTPRNPSADTFWAYKEWALIYFILGSSGPYFLCGSGGDAIFLNRPVVEDSSWGPDRWAPSTQPHRCAGFSRGVRQHSLPFRVRLKPAAVAWGDASGVDSERKCEPGDGPGLEGGVQRVGWCVKRRGWEDEGREGEERHCGRLRPPLL